MAACLRREAAFIASCPSPGKALAEATMENGTKSMNSIIARSCQNKSERSAL
jgi:hypothetical protein